ncbi:MAG TPA: glycosyltransferase family 1 protein [Gemmatimonadales bacterium]
MRIALVSDTYEPQVNGVTTVLRRMVDGLLGARHDAVVVAPEYPGQQPGSQPGELRIPSMAFPPYPAIRLSLPAHRRVAQFLDAFRPDLVHVATEGPLGMVGRRYAMKRGLPLVTSYHTHFPRYCHDYGIGMLEPAVWRWVSWFHRPAVLTQTPGTDARDALKAHGINAVIWGRGVDTRRFHHDKRDLAFRRRLGAHDNQAMVLHVGRLAAEKNTGILIRSFETARESLGNRAVFVIAGEGPMGEKIAEKLPWVTRLGFLDRGTLAMLYASADLCVLPSYTETCGLVALEAMASGLPVVAADACGFQDNVGHQISGLLVSPHDPMAFAAAIAGLVLNRTLRCRMSSEARLAAVARDLGPENEELFDQYRRVLGRPEERDAWRAAS